MAKLGLEVEGEYRDTDLETYFCSADEYVQDMMLFTKLFMYDVDHIYISDHHNELDLDELADMFEGTDYMVTVEVTALDSVPPEGIEIFWNASQASYAQARTIKFLRSGDQIKIENEKTVFSWTVGDAIIALPEDFEGDIEV